MNAQLTIFAEVNTKILAVSTTLEKMANNVHQSQLLVQGLESKLSKQEQRMSTRNTALSTATSTVGTAQATREVQMGPEAQKANNSADLGINLASAPTSRSRR